MALNLKSPEADRLARELAEATGESITAAVTTALAERLVRVRTKERPGLLAEIDAIRRRAAKLKNRDMRSDDEILGYNADGTFER
ncbi:MAG: type II toxin-antitoxin system VapB family antitoxin [Rhodospirillales bacterium]|nr:type II toxin-antitoxin system VapB family antitoxin [Rhodospirillales bacterium]